MKRIERVLLLSATTIGFAIGCGDDSSPSADASLNDGAVADVSDAGPPDALPSYCEPQGESWLLLGGGDFQRGFEELADGEAMTVVLGPDGFYRLTVSVRAQGIYPGQADRQGHPVDPLIGVETWLDADVVGDFSPTRLGMSPTPDGYEKLGLWVAFHGQPPVGQTVTLKAQVSDSCGVTVSDELDVVVTL